MASDIRDVTNYLPTYSIEERNRRWALIREQMYQRDLDALLIWGSDEKSGMGNAHLRYVTHTPITAGEGIALFPLSDDPTVFSGSPHHYKPFSVYDAYQHWVDDTRPFGKDMSQIGDELTERGLDDGRIGIVSHGVPPNPPFTVPYPNFKELRNQVPEAEFTDATDIIQRCSLIKSDEEIEMLRRAGEIAESMARGMESAAEAGRMECEVFADIVRTQIANGGEAFVFNFFDSGPPTTGERVHMLHGKRPPLAPTQRKLDSGDILMTEFHAAYGGIVAHAENTVVIDDAPPELEALHDVGLECFDNGVDALRPGARFKDVVEAFREPARDAGIEYVELGVHGHGYASPNFPTAVYPQGPTKVYPDGLGNHPYTARGLDDLRIREGMVFGTNGDIFDPDWRDDLGAMIGGTVLVTDSGPEIIVDASRKLVV